MPGTVVDLFRERVAETPDAPGFLGRHGQTWTSLSWSDVAYQGEAVAAGLLSLGVTKGDRVGILASTRLEWALADLGVLLAGAATTTIYTANTPEECAWVLGDAEVVCCFVEDLPQLNKLMKVKSALPELKHVVLLDGASPLPWVLSWPALIERGRAALEADPGQLDRVAESLGPEDLATLIYTSGTTGRSKGVRLVHDCWVSMAEGAKWLLDFAEEDELVFLFLPLAHSFAKATLFGAVYTGTPVALDGDLERIQQSLAELRPTFVPAVPRVFEKIYNQILRQVRARGPRAERVFKWAVDVGRRVSHAKQAKRPEGVPLRLQWRLADRLVFSKIRERFGGRLRIWASGGAPLPVELAEFFDGAGMVVMEGYGLTESSAASVANRPDDYRLGTVGKPMPGVEVRVAEDGEVLLRGRCVMRGYHKRPDATAEVLDAEGWLHTGDIGELDADGFLRITDRKKDVIITSGGKNIAPQPIEAALRAASPLISNAVLHGDKRNFCVALITIDPDEAASWMAERGLELDTYAAALQLPELRAAVQEAVAQVNARLPSHETVKDFAILEREFSVARGELTAKQSVRRRVVEREHKALLDGFYAGAVEQL